MTECLERVVDMLDKEWGIRSIQAWFLLEISEVLSCSCLWVLSRSATRLRGRLVCDYRYRVLAASSHKVG